MRNFPFSAICGQQRLKQALMLAAVDPLINGVLISGPRGVAKSTTAKAFFDVLPADDVSTKFVHLPLGSSEEMLTGSLDLEQVLQEKTLVFKDGLLAKAHRGVLYVDEVNLLADNLVDLLLDVAASGVNRVERDGLSHSHDSQFLLMGTMNPDEGELRPQLLDRFGLMVKLNHEISIEERVQIVDRREAFDENPEHFCKAFTSAQKQITQEIVQARKLLRSVSISQALKINIAEKCMASGAEGLRADIVLTRAAKAHAALAQRQTVTEHDIEAVSELVLCHRRKPIDQASPPMSPPHEPPSMQPPSSGKFKRPPECITQDQKTDQQPEGDFGEMPALTTLPVSQATADVKSLLKAEKQKSEGYSTKTKSAESHLSNRIDYFKTIHQSQGDLTAESLVYKKQHSMSDNAHYVLLDVSASTLKDQQISRMKKLVEAIQAQAYLAREKFSVYSFGHGEIQVIQPLSKTPKALSQILDNVAAGGGTPLREIVEQASQQLKHWVTQKGLSMTTYLITDGRTQQSVDDIQLLGKVIVIDTEQGPIKRGRCRQIAASLQADYRTLAEFLPS